MKSNASLTQVQRTILPSRDKTVEELLKTLATCEISADDPREGLDNAFQLTVALIDQKAGWYRGKVRNRRRMSLGFRIGAIVALAVALLAPYAATAWPTHAAALPSIGYMAMAIGGILMLADRVFVATNNWVRFAEVQVDLEERLFRLHYDWKGRQYAWTAEGLGTATAKRELEFLRGVADEVALAVKTETEAWATEVRTGVDLLGQHLNLSKLSEQARKGLIEAHAFGDPAYIRLAVAFAKAPADQGALRIAVGPVEKLDDAVAQQVDRSSPQAVFLAERGGRRLRHPRRVARRYGTHARPRGRDRSNRRTHPELRARARSWTVGPRDLVTNLGAV